MGFKKKRRELLTSWDRELSKFDSKRSVPAYLEANMDKYAYEDYATNKEAEYGALYAKLLSYGLSSKAAKIVCFKVCFNWTLGDIAAELHIPHRQTVHTIYMRSLEKLREGGFRK